MLTTFAPLIVGRLTLFAAAFLILAHFARAESVWLSSLDLTHVKVTDKTQPTIDKTIDGKPLAINGKTFERGVCFHGDTLIYVNLDGGAERFTAVAGVDDEIAPVPPDTSGRQGGGRRGGGQGRGRGPAPMSVRFIGEDGKVLSQTANLRRGADGVPIDVDTRGVKLLAIIISSGNATPVPANRVDLVDAKFEVIGNLKRPRVVPIPGDAREVLTPKAGREPKINGPGLTGVSARRPVLYRIPATGARPITFSATGLPAGLTLDSATGIISGEIRQKGTYPVVFTAKNSSGQASREFKFVAEGTLALTPPLGWNSWNARGRRVTDELIRQTADAFVDKGLADHGWTYICIDDGWERTNREGDELNEGPTRDENGRFITNKKFPDMKALGDYIHSKGLKYGIYSSPGPTTCQGLEASQGHEELDVAQWCEWGVDYLKYDWCSYRATEEGVAGAQAPYRLMRSVLDKAPRDIVYSICQYGNQNVWEWGNNSDIRGNLWRTTRDIRDTWWQTRDIGFNPRWSQIDIAQYGGPGHWNDVDMLVVGVVGWSYEPLHETKLSPAEQYSHISLWVLHAAPLILGCHLHEADDFTVNLLTNDEVLAVNQDPLGRGAKAVYASDNGNLQVWSRPLADGSKAVGLFNLDEVPLKVTAEWSDIGVSGRQMVRDLWRQRDLGPHNGEFSAEIPRHGCVLVKISPAAAN
ncbi:MAG: NPCBM/NEW2 domain-containing protein [Pirellulales bacterium]